MWGVWVQTRRTFWKKCHCRQMTWSSQREDKEQTLEEMGGQHAPRSPVHSQRKKHPKQGGQSLTSTHGPVPVEPEGSVALVDIRGLLGQGTGTTSQIQLMPGAESGFLRFQ